MTLAPVVDLSLARLVQLEERIGESESNGLRARWEFGHELLRARDGKGRLPNGYLTRVCGELDLKRAEAGARMKFAETFPTEDELSDAVRTFGSWHAIVHDALPERDASEPRRDMPPIPVGVYRTIVADPPWQYDNKATRGAAEDHYPTMPIDELCALPIGERAADESHLYLWTTNGFLREAFGVMEAWGFTYKTTLVWVKPQLGLGNYFRSSTEYVLFGIRGGLRTLDCNRPNWFQAKRARHSAKPDLFLDMVEEVSPGPYLELFARRRRMGWDVWGNEA